jgi:hypothetical protein
MKITKLKSTLDFKPFGLVQSYQYRCENKFFIYGLNFLNEDYERFSIIIDDVKNSLFVTLQDYQG